MAIIGAVASTGGAAAIFSNFVAGTGLQTLRNFLDGLEGMLDSTEEHNPYVDVVLDVIKVVLDAGSIVANGLSALGLIKTSTIKAAAGVGAVALRIFGSVGQLLKGKPTDFANQVGPAMSMIMGSASTLTGLGQLIGDVGQVSTDWGNAQAYSASHS